MRTQKFQFVPIALPENLALKCLIANTARVPMRVTKICLTTLNVLIGMLGTCATNVKEFPKEFTNAKAKKIQQQGQTQSLKFVLKMHANFVKEPI